MAGHHPNHRPRRGQGAPGNREGGRGIWLARTSPKGEGLSDLDEEAAWFSSPWRDGRNAVRLLETLGILLGGSSLPAAVHAIMTKPADAISSADYASLEDTSLQAGLRPGVDGVIIPAAAGCLGNWIANSHGGGHVPNVYLRSTVGWLLWRGLPVDTARWETGRARGRDVLSDDGLIAEFARLWFGRRYVAAWRLVERR